jgi:hypothetical protein
MRPRAVSHQDYASAVDVQAFGIRKQSGDGVGDIAGLILDPEIGYQPIAIVAKAIPFEVK